MNKIDKKELIEKISANDNVIIINPDKELLDICNSLNGKIINLGLKSNENINPFDINLDIDYAVPEKDDEIYDLYEIINKKPLNSIQKSIISKALRELYEPYLLKVREVNGAELKKAFKTVNFNDLLENIPTLSDFYRILMSYPELEAKDLARNIKHFLFNNRTNTNTNDCSIIAYNIEDMCSELKEISQYACLCHAFNTITKNFRKNDWKYTWLFINNMDDFLKNPAMLKKLEFIFKRSRIYGGIIVGQLNNIKELSSMMDDAKMNHNEKRAILNVNRIVLSNNDAYETMLKSEYYKDAAEFYIFKAENADELIEAIAEHNMARSIWVEE